MYLSLKNNNRSKAEQVMKEHLTIIPEYLRQDYLLHFFVDQVELLKKQHYPAKGMK